MIVDILSENLDVLKIQSICKLLCSALLGPELMNDGYAVTQ